MPPWGHRAVNLFCTVFKRKWIKPAGFWSNCSTCDVGGLTGLGASDFWKSGFFFFHFKVFFVCKIVITLKTEYLAYSEMQTHVGIDAFNEKIKAT